jgi:NAD(P)-dependent dehydrogenase (short-subunit alcohol dehydrogenase family)
MSAPVALALILGASVNISSHIARTFAAKVALSSRSARDEDSTAGFLNIRGGNVGSELRPGRLHRVAAGLGNPFLSNLPAS